MAVYSAVVKGEPLDNGGASSRPRYDASWRENAHVLPERASESYIRGMASRACAMSGTIGNDVRLLAAIAYEEASMANDPEEIGGITFALAISEPTLSTRHSADHPPPQSRCV